MRLGKVSEHRLKRKGYSVVRIDKGFGRKKTTERHIGRGNPRWWLNY